MDLSLPSAQWIRRTEITLLPETTEQNVKVIDTGPTIGVEDQLFSVVRFEPDP